MPGRAGCGYASELDEVLTQAARSTGAHIGAIYLLADEGHLLLMDTEIGLPAQIVKPWTRVRVNAGVPVAAAVRQRQLIWVQSHQEMACRFPGTALALPYPFATAAAPLHTGSRVWGSWVLLWPASHPYELAPDELDVINSACHKLSALLQQAADGGQPLRAAGEPRVLKIGRAHV